MLLYAKLSLQDDLIWIAASTADIPADNANGIKTLLANGVITLYINDKPAVINEWIKWRNLPSWLVTFVVVPLFSKDLITFIISFIPLFVGVITGPVIDKVPFLIFLICIKSYILKNIFI